MQAQFLALAAAVTTALAALGAEARTVIVVNPGPFPSPEAAASAEAAIDWTDGKRADGTVVTECFAAMELQHYLRRMSGRGDDFAIVDDRATPDGDLVLVGGPASNSATRQLAKRLGLEAKGLEALGPEGYRILSTRAAGRKITVLAGGGRVGTLYACYDLLYRLGCRWFAPGELHEEVPHVETIPDLDVTQRPAFVMRGFLAWEDRGNPEFFLWMARNRLNEWCVEQGNHPLLNKLGIRMVGGLHDAEERFLNPSSPYPYRHPQGDAKGDGKLTYFEAHPEWFPMVKGRRVPGIQGWGGTNFCTSNPHATDEFMKNFLRAIVEGPYRDAEVIRFWTLDGGRWCECPECKALGTPTDRNLLLVYRLDREIKKAQSQGKIRRPILIRFLAYADVLEPPRRPLPADFDYTTCWATYYPIARCYVHEFDDRSCAVNARYLSQLQGWATDPGRNYRGQLQIGEYYNVSGYKCLPINFARSMAYDIPCYYRLGARQFEYMHVTTGRWGTKALTNYQMARQLWNVDTECQALWNDYFAKRYGPADPPMRAFYVSLERMLANVTEIKYDLARRLNQGSDKLFPTSHLRFERTPGLACDGPTWSEIVGHSRACRSVLDGVLASKLPDRVRARVAEDEQTFAYAERTMAYYDACIRAFQAVRAKRLDEARGHYARAREVARSLAEDKLSTSMSASHANAANAFEATLAQGALARFAKALEGRPGK